MKKKANINKVISFPGESISEQLEYIGMSQAELAERMGRSIPKINELIKGKAPLTEDTALKLENVIGLSSQTLLNYERIYRDSLLLLKKQKILEGYIEWSKKFPVIFLKSLGFLPKNESKLEIADSLLKFFGVATPIEWEKIYRNKSLSFKIELKQIIELEAVSSWLRIGDKQVEFMKYPNFDQKKLKGSLKFLKSISYSQNDNWFNECKSKLKDCGVALVFTPQIKRAPIRGAVRWIFNGRLPLIQLTDRYKSNDSFWFAFYHEIAHLILHGKKYSSISGLDQIVQDKEKENEADHFAKNCMISEKESLELMRLPIYDRSNILEYSKQHQIHPGFVVGRLQFKGVLKYSSPLNKLKRKVDLSEEISSK